MPNLYIISGCNGSGKTTASYSLLPKMLGCNEFVNSDEFAKSISPFDPNAAAVGASRFMLQKISYMLERQKDFGIETTLATRTLTGILQRAREQGYRITIIYLWLESPELAVDRIRRRVQSGGHNITTDTVQRRYSAGLHYFFETYKPMADRWVLADNTRPPFAVVAEGSAEMTIVRNRKKYEQILNSLNDTE
ncbi:MAG: zeta toxin family protein [Bacteroidales bacterium]|nr:zeta toxin family protein [Bacteroidales bacterium]